MTNKPVHKGSALLWLPLFILSVLVTASCGGGDKKQPADATSPQAKEKIKYGGPGPMGGDTISIGMADSMIANYRANLASVLNGTYKGDTTLMPFSETFDKSILEQLLAQDGLAGVRIYMCMGANGKIKMLLVGTDRDGKDILQPGSREGREKDNKPKMVVEEGTRHP
jgi:hypothetical protein